jgi:hypothetical protein
MLRKRILPYAVGWGDGPPETAGDDNCQFAMARLVTMTAMLGWLAWKVVRGR